MNQVLNIAKMTVLMSFRRGTMPAVLAVVVILSTLIFNIARSDGQLINELEIRLLYSYGFSYSVLSLIAIAIACFTVRAQLDAKNIHLLTSYPIPRKLIFLGQGLGVAFIVFISEVVLFGSILANAWYFSKGADVEVYTSVKEKFVNSRKSAIPEYVSKRDLALKYAEENNIDAERLNEVQWSDLYEKAVFNEQSIERGEQKIWYFDTGTMPLNIKDVSIKFKFRQGSKRQKVKGIVEVKGINSATYFKKEIEADQFQLYEIKVPRVNLPEDGQFTLSFKNEGSYSTIVTRSGLSIEYVTGSFLKQCLETDFCTIYSCVCNDRCRYVCWFGLIFFSSKFFSDDALHHVYSRRNRCSGYRGITLFCSC